MPTFTNAISTLCWKFQSEQGGKKKKRHQIEKETVKLSLFTDDIILYKIPKNPRKKVTRAKKQTQ